MTQLELRPLKHTSNVDILAAIKNDASPAYQTRIPDATKATMQETMADLLNYRPHWNEFQESLINRIGRVIVRNMIWTNPLAPYKRGMLEFGETIEEVNVGLIKSHTYNPDRLYLERDLFGNWPVPVQTSYHGINRQVQYPFTINESLLKRAFINDDGLSKFIASQMAAPVNSDNWDEFLMTCELFKLMHDNGKMFTVNVANLSTSTNADDSRYFIQKVRELTSTLQFISEHYNPAGMPVFAKPDELVLFITASANAAIDVEALAAAFNINKMAMPEIEIIPDENMDIVGAQAILTTRDFFVIADNKIETTNMWNPRALTNNWFLHHWSVISASRFAPAILFSSTEDSTIINMIETPVSGITNLAIADPTTGDVVTDVTRGNLYQVLGNVVTNPEGGPNDALLLKVVPEIGNALYNADLSPRTYVTVEGVLHVGYDEPNAGLTVELIAEDNETITVSTNVTVVGDLLTLWPNPQVETDNDNDGVLEPDYPESLDLDDDGNVLIPEVEGVTWTNEITTGVAFTVAGNKVTIPSHGLNVADEVKFGAITSTTNFTAGTEYYVISVIDDNTVTLSATEGGAVVVVNAAGTAASATVTVHEGTVLNVPTGTTVTLTGTPNTGYELPTGVTGVYTLTH